MSLFEKEMKRIQKERRELLLTRHGLLVGIQQGSEWMAREGSRLSEYIQVGGTSPNRISDVQLSLSDAYHSLTLYWRSFLKVSDELKELESDEKDLKYLYGLEEEEEFAFSIPQGLKESLSALSNSCPSKSKKKKKRK